MMRYGGSVMNYAVAFSMTRLLTLMLSAEETIAPKEADESLKGIFDLNYYAHSACSHTGF
eukprot:2721585-Prymnesium_polylepis.2